MPGKSIVIAAALIGWFVVPGPYGAAMIRHQAGEQQPSPERRAAERAEQSLIGQSARFFRRFGIA